jgi:hypothetical protein
MYVQRNFGNLMAATISMRKFAQSGRPAHISYIRGSKTVQKLKIAETCEGKTAGSAEEDTVFTYAPPPPSSNRLANEFAVRKISLLRSVEALRRPTRSAVSYDSNLEPVARLLIIIYSYTLGLVVGYIESFFQRT